jgi:D-aminoacyl-tRNA deacylase
MYSKYLVVASKKDIAGINITTALSQFRKNPIISSIGNSSNFDFYLCEEEIIYTENLNLEKINSYDFIIFASKHQSEKHTKTLSIHSPGNWLSTQPKLGGESERVCKTSALFQKQAFEILKKNRDKYSLNNYEITLECTHHGPLIEKPCMFIEIGSTEEEWKDRRAGFVIAKTISDVIEEFKGNPYSEIAIGIGGPHYCPNFNKIQLNSNVAISHIIPQYVLPLKEEMVREAIEKTEEEVDFILLDWKGLGNSEMRNQTIKVLDKFYLQYKRTSSISK